MILKFFLRSCGETRFFASTVPRRKLSAALTAAYVVNIILLTVGSNQVAYSMRVIEANGCSGTIPLGADFGGGSSRSVNVPT